MADRQDFLAECNDQRVPVEDFRLSFCSRCVQPECTRSQYGTALFDQRTQTWVERLFTEVPTMNPSDPRFLPIAGRQFKTLDQGPVPSVSTGSQWLDPRDVPEEPEPPALILPASAPVAIEKPALAAVKEVPAAPPPDLPGAKNLPHALLLMNAPAQQKMLPLASETPERPRLPSKDPWAAPVPLSPEGAVTTDGVVVKRGATIKFGD